MTRSIFDNIEQTTPARDYETPSKAVVCNQDGDGIVLWYAGAHIDGQINVDGIGVRLDNLGLDDAPEGISVWEGKFVDTSYDTVDGREYDVDVVGDFRDPTPEEWAAICRNECPWEGDDA